MPRLTTIVVAGALVLAGCGGGGDGIAEEDSVPDAQRANNQDLRVAVGPDPFVASLTASPPNYNLGLTTNGPNPGIFETLTRLTAVFGLQPGLATRWESSTPAQWKFFLRPNVTFHNGQPADASAVVANLETIARRQNRPRGLDPGVAKVNGDVVELNLTAANGRLAEQLASPTMGIVAPGTQAGPGSDPALTPTGTGPFKFRSYQPNATLVSEAYEGYWGAKPQLKTITFRFGPEADAGRLLATRGVDIAGGQVPYSLLPKVSGRTDQFAASQPARAQYLLLNAAGIEQYATLKDDAVRQAVALAIDRNAVRKAGWPDDGEDNASVIPKVVLSEAADRVRPPNQNPDNAKKLLDQAGWQTAADGVRAKGGQALVLSLILARPQDQQQAAKAVQSQLAAVGIGVTVVDPAPDSPFIRINTGSFDLFMASQAQEDANPCALCRFFSVRPGGQLAYASAVGGGAEADELYDRTYAALSIDTARRTAADLINVVVSKRFTAVPLASVRTEWLISPRVRGFEPAALGGDQRWDNVWLTV